MVFLRTTGANSWGGFGCSAASTTRAANVSKPLLVVVTGLDKPFRTTLSDADYAKVRRLGDEYLSRNPRCFA